MNLERLKPETRRWLAEAARRHPDLAKHLASPTVDVGDPPQERGLRPEEHREAL